MALASCQNQGGRQSTQTLRLPPCSAEGSIFAEKKFDDWKDFYHENVSRVIEAHLGTLNNTNDLPLKCTEDSYAELMPATEELKEVAQLMPAWRENEESFENLHETDMGSVLLEFLRVYECSMRERQQYLTVRVLQEENAPANTAELEEKKNEQREEMEKEIAIARSTLNRTFSVVSGYDRLRPMMLDIECIKRASLDLRNVLGLASDASACLPRIWDTHQSLRDLPD